MIYTTPDGLRHYCYYCGQWRELNDIKLCADCLDKWYDAPLRKGTK